MSPTPLHIIILAAGEGTRMRSNLPKVLQPLGGRPLLAHLLDTARQLDPAGVHVVYGSGGDAVRAALTDYPDIHWVLQEQRLGTGHAVTQAMPDIDDNAQVLVLMGDHPLIPVNNLRVLLQRFRTDLAFLTMNLEQPNGYGRVVRDRIGRVEEVVEQKDASSNQLRINEVNTGIIVSNARILRGWLARLSDDNQQAEYYLTDIFAMAHNDGAEIQGVLADDARLLEGANDRRQLAALERLYQGLMIDQLLAQGVTLADPARVDIRGEIKTGLDVFIDVNCVFEGQIKLGDNCRIGPGCLLRDCELGNDTQVKAYSVLEGVQTGSACEIGPYARLRPGTVLGKQVKIGNFVETKKAELADGTKASHLSYLGDTTIGSGVNIGAGTITCNYDGVNKHQTIIGDDVFVGSDTQFVAPVNIGKGATIGAGTTVTEDVPAEKLVISRVRQRIVPNWRKPQKKKS